MLGGIRGQSLMVAATLSLIAAPVATSAAIVPVDHLIGLELPGATATSGTFEGVSWGAPGGAGVWRATVVHGLLAPISCPAAPVTARCTTTIRGGSFAMQLAGGGTVVGGFNLGTIVTRAGAGLPRCSDETYSVRDTMTTLTGEVWSFDVALTHLVVRVAGACRTYGATVLGILVTGPA